VRLQAVPLTAGGKSFEVEGVIGGSTPLARGQGPDAETLTLEYTGLRVINVENFGDKGVGSVSATDVRKVDLKDAIESRLGAGHKTVSRKELRNVGPSINYKLRDASGQAREFHNYMEPIDLGEGVPVFLMGLRETPAEEFRYLRLPADESGRLDSFLRLREALADPAVREQAVRRYAARATDPARPELAQQLAASAGRALALFAGVGTAAGPNGKPVAGLQALSDFMEANVPEADRTRAGEVVVRIVNGALFEVAQIARARAGLKPLDMTDASRAFMNQAVLALSDLTLYPAPMAFQLKDFTQVQASVFQVARAPGRNIVYLGCALLIVGIFAMLYVRERRLWVWLTPQDADGSRATLALSSNRKTMDTDREFAHLRTQLLDPTPP
jgi:cytochrome c biogenesis protein